MKLVNGISCTVKTIHGVFADLNFLPVVPRMRDVFAIVPIEIIQPIEGLHVPIPKLGTEVVVGTSSGKHSFRHILSYSPEVERVGIVPDHFLTQFTSPEKGLFCFMISVK